MNVPRVTRGDVAIMISVVLLAGALLAPVIRSRAFHRLTAAAAADVDALRGAALSTFTSTGRWPTPAPAGTAPTELSGAFPGDSALVRSRYRLQWITLEVVEYVDAPAAPVEAVPGDTPPDSSPSLKVPVIRRRGAVVLRSADSDLLADLLTRFGSDASFVRGSTWTLVVMDSAAVTP
jgi:hypothetical protein